MNLPRINADDESEFRKFLRYYRWTVGWIAFMTTIIAVVAVSRAFGVDL